MVTEGLLIDCKNVNFWNPALLLGLMRFPLHICCTAVLPGSFQRPIVPHLWRGAAGQAPCDRFRVKMGHGVGYFVCQ